MDERTEVKIGRHSLEVTNLQKILYPEVGFTKGEVIDFYMRIAPVLLPHLKNRPLTLKRYPNGVGGPFFYEKQCPAHRPTWVKTHAVESKLTRGKVINYCVINDVASLVWAANLADLELHVSLARAPEVARPTSVVFDLDPGPGADIVECCQVALWIQEVLDEFRLQSFCKTSGSKGLQLYIPLNTPTTYAQTRPFSRALAELIVKQHPDLAVAKQEKSIRNKKVLIDWLQNDESKTTVCVYSLRGKSRPTVSTPVTWDEVKKCLKSGDPETLVFTSDDVLARVKKRGDLFEPVLKLKQKLTRVQ